LDGLVYLAMRPRDRPGTAGLFARVTQEMKVHPQIDDLVRGKNARTFLAFAPIRQVAAKTKEPKLEIERDTLKAFKIFACRIQTSLYHSVKSFIGVVRRCKGHQDLG